MREKLKARYALQIEELRRARITKQNKKDRGRRRAIFAAEMRNRGEKGLQKK